MSGSAAWEAEEDLGPITIQAASSQQPATSTSQDRSNNKAGDCGGAGGHSGTLLEENTEAAKPVQKKNCLLISYMLIRYVLFTRYMTIFSNSLSCAR